MRTSPQSRERSSGSASRGWRSERRGVHRKLWYANAVYAILLVIAGLAPRIPTTVVGLVTDTWVHALAYGLQAILLFLAMSGPLPPIGAAWLSFLGASAFGAVVELLQYLQPSRLVENTDLIANTGGALAATLLILVLRYWSVRWRRAAGE